VPEFPESRGSEFPELTALRYRSNQSARNRIRELDRRVAELASVKHLNLRYGVIDARPKQSASKL
jgi:hypothetical protein